MQNLLVWVFIAPLILITIMAHELAHGFVADKLGDPTPRRHGRLTLNPIAHLDLVGTLMLLITRRFGWAKPVPVNPSNFANPLRDMGIVGSAGPLANFIIAYLSGLLLRLEVISPHSILGFILILTVQLNLGLGIFNLIPIPPLDGSRILMGLLPPQQAYSFAKFEQYGFIVLLFLVFMGGDLINLTLIPLLSYLFRLFTGLPLTF